MSKLRQPMQMMRRDCCRGCGLELTVKSTCNKCGIPKTFNCKKCGRWAEDPPHDCKLFLN